MVECELGKGEEKVPETRGERSMSGGEDGEEVVFGGLHGTFSREGAVLIRGGEGDGDVVRLEEGTEGL